MALTFLKEIPFETDDRHFLGKKNAQQLSCLI